VISAMLISPLMNPIPWELRVRHLWFSSPSGATGTWSVVRELAAPWGTASRMA